jgi:hypothetical protein
MKPTKTASILAVISVSTVVICAYYVIQHNSIEQVNFETYLYNPALLARHKTLCSGVLGLANRCLHVDKVATKFENLQAIYDQRKLVYDDLKFLLTMQGRRTLRKELRRELKTIKKLMEEANDYYPQADNKR